MPKRSWFVLSTVDALPEVGPGVHQRCKKLGQWSAPCWPHCGRPARSCSGKAHKGPVHLGFVGLQDRTILLRVATLAPDHPMLCSRTSAARPGSHSSRASLRRLGLSGCQALSVSRCGQLRWMLKPSGSARPEGAHCGASSLLSIPFSLRLAPLRYGPRKYFESSPWPRACTVQTRPMTKATEAAKAANDASRNSPRFGCPALANEIRGKKVPTCCAAACPLHLEGPEPFGAARSSESGGGNLLT